MHAVGVDERVAVRDPISKANGRTQRRAARAPPGRQGTIEIGDRSSMIEVPDPLADDIIAALKGHHDYGKKVPVRRDSKA